MHFPVNNLSFLAKHFCVKAYYIPWETSNPLTLWHLGHHYLSTTFTKMDQILFWKTKREKHTLKLQKSTHSIHIICYLWRSSIFKSHTEATESSKYYARHNVGCEFFPHAINGKGALNFLLSSDLPQRVAAKFIHFDFE